MSKKFSKHRKEKIRKIALEKGYGKWMIGKKHSEKTKRKMSMARKGKPFSGKKANWKGRKHSEESKKKMSLAHTGKIISEKTRLKMSNSNKGKKSYLWKGGLTQKNLVIRHGIKYRLWREAVFRRDNYMCIWGGKNHGSKLQADHIKSFASHPQLRFAIDNGRTLCEDCHRTTDTFGNRKVIHR